jgi:ABC-2 type transport system ATP-binding protein
MAAGRAGPVITVDHLRKTYGTAVAADDVSFSVAEREIFGIIGPNGAGKTTTVECVSGLRVPDTGTIRVLGLDPQRDRAALRECVGVQLQEGALRSKLTVFELADLFASFYDHPADPGALLDMLGLTPEAQRLLQAPLGRAEAAAVDRARARRQPGDSHPRRADHRA